MAYATISKGFIEKRNLLQKCGKVKVSQKVLRKEAFRNLFIIFKWKM